MVAVEKIRRAVNAALNSFVDVRFVSSLSPLFSVPQRSGCATSVCNSSDVIAVLKHNFQLSALTSPSAFNKAQGSSIMGETGTLEAVLRDASCPVHDP